MGLNLEQHEPTAACDGLHCFACNVDEATTPSYIVCGECFHVYKTARALRKAYRRTWSQLIRITGPRALWWWLRTRLRKASHIYCCPMCAHDF